MKCLVYFDFNGNLSYEVSTQTLITTYNEDDQEIEKERRNISLRRFYTMLKRQYDANKHQLDIISY